MVEDRNLMGKQGEVKVGIHIYTHPGRIRLKRILGTGFCARVKIGIRNLLWIRIFVKGLRDLLAVGLGFALTYKPASSINL